LSDFRGSDIQGSKTLEAIRRPDCGWFYTANPDEFKKIPRSPVAYWVTSAARDNYLKGVPLEEIAVPKQGATTSDNNRFLRLWFEVSVGDIGSGFLSREQAATSIHKWFPYNKGGSYRRWHGNQEFVVNFENDGEEIRAFHEVLNKTSPGGRLKNRDCYFKQQLSWSKISSGSFSVRYFAPGFIFDVAGSAIFTDQPDQLRAIGGLLNSEVSTYYLAALSPTLNYEAEHLRKIPYLEVNSTCFERLVCVSKADWDSFETSRDFLSLPLLAVSTRSTATIESCYITWIANNRETTSEMKRLEEENNRLFIDAYGLSDVLSSDIPIDQITLTVNPAYRYGRTFTEKERWARFSQDTMQELVSYAIGCMMGRYSLDAPGLIYAHAGNEGFDPSQYKTFPADADGIVPITDEAWFDDDGANRIREFVRVVWSEDTETENMSWLAESLGTQRGESADDTIRRYLSKQFYKDHLQTYKKRPIYWLFSSGKHKAFEALVYLHRYNAGTLSRMRMEYVVPLQSRMQSRINSLEQDIVAAASSAETRRLQKQRDQLVKQLDELRRFDESLRHYADQRITLDLDDGVKVNYGKFGGLLAEVIKVTGKK
jgi:type II restriction/modification system DNA methylase subunit YeeA